MITFIHNLNSSFNFLQVFNLDHESKTWNGLSLPDDLTVDDALKRVLRLPSVASKRYLTNKVCVQFLYKLCFTDIAVKFLLH